MSVDSREKRFAMMGFGVVVFPEGVTPNAGKDAQWRSQMLWGYSGILAEPPEIVITVSEDECTVDWSIDELILIGAPSDDEFTEEPAELVTAGRVHDWSIG